MCKYVADMLKWMWKNKSCKLAFIHFNPLPDDKILDWFKLKQIADETLKCI